MIHVQDSRWRHKCASSFAGHVLQLQLQLQCFEQDKQLHQTWQSAILTMQQWHILHCTLRYYNCTNCDQLHVKICPALLDSNGDTARVRVACSFQLHHENSLINPSSSSRHSLIVLIDPVTTCTNQYTNSTHIYASFTRYNNKQSDSHQC